MYDSVIVGQGLAGSLLAWELIQAGESVLVVDNGHRHASSWVAAGLINPVTGMRMVLSPHTAAWLEVADASYTALSRQLGIQLRHALPMWRIFTNAKQQQAWQERLGEQGYADYLSAPRPGSEARPYRAELGFAEVAHCGYLDTKALLLGLRDWLLARQAYVQRELDYGAIELQAEGLRLEGMQARRLIFCEGYRAAHNPWFGQLPLSPVKGEILTLHGAEALPEVIANFGKWVLPLGEGRYKLGATYDWQSQELQATAQARRHLLDELQRYIIEPLRLEVVAHEVGMRPNSRDRMPLLGAHPNAPQLWVFNGFGSRGSLMIPYYARQLRRHLLLGEALDPDCAIGRWS